MKHWCQIEAEVTKKLRAHMIELAAGTYDPFPTAVALGGDSTRLPVSMLEQDPAAIGKWKRELAEKSSRWPDIDIETRPRRAFGTTHVVPTRLVIGSLSTALDMTRTRRDYERAVFRLDSLRPFSPPIEEAVSFVRSTWKEPDVDFSLLVSAATWFRDNMSDGRSFPTPRQVPLEGFSGKWLNVKTRRSQISSLVGRDIDLNDDLRTSWFELRYVDPVYVRDNPRNLFGAWRAPDELALAYPVETIMIVENIDCFLDPVPIDHGIVVFGQGKRGPKAISSCNALNHVRQIIYWGDMDADGLEILSSYRAHGLAIDSILMDKVSYKCWSRFGTNDVEKGKRPLSEHRHRDGLLLEPGEQRLYDMLTSPDFTGPRRVEQERIPNEAVLSALMAAKAQIADNKKLAREDDGKWEQGLNCKFRRA